MLAGAGSLPAGIDAGTIASRRGRNTSTNRPAGCQGVWIRRSDSAQLEVESIAR